VPQRCSQPGLAEELILKGMITTAQGVSLLTEGSQ
jgi:hypothetical protein